MSESTRSRFKDAVWFKPEYHITIGGIGSIGSWLALFMGRIVDNINIYEMDVIEEHNLSGQLYPKNHVGLTKLASIRRTLSEFSPQSRIRGNGEFQLESPVTPICFSCFDSMKARRLMFEQWKKDDNRMVFIDGRLTAEDFWVYTVIPGREEEYEKMLFSDDEVDDLPCSFKSTTHISSMLASYMVNMYTNYITNVVYKDDIASLPFEIVYNAPLNLLETKEVCTTLITAD